MCIRDRSTQSTGTSARQQMAESSDDDESTQHDIEAMRMKLQAHHKASHKRYKDTIMKTAQDETSPVERVQTPDPNDHPMRKPASPPSREQIAACNKELCVLQSELLDSPRRARRRRTSLKDRVAAAEAEIVALKSLGELIELEQPEPDQPEKGEKRKSQSSEEIESAAAEALHEGEPSIATRNARRRRASMDADLEAIQAQMAARRGSQPSEKPTGESKSRCLTPLDDLDPIPDDDDCIEHMFEAARDSYLSRGQAPIRSPDPPKQVQQPTTQREILSDLCALQQQLLATPKKHRRSSLRERIAAIEAEVAAIAEADPADSSSDRPRRRSLTERVAAAESELAGLRCEDELSAATNAVSEVSMRCDESMADSSEEDSAVSYTHLRAHETVLDLVCRLLLEKKKKTPKSKIHTKR
eukprot:TRINITY_DN11560_c0_g1_i6.p1 TRINITY_DN11560_c0_g1~~TRINITY_DN11560_c0_g1_i6.p1  ORF type:complete len:415 (+),score=102.83 TRINITY_DN11560_c0_g1_i6:139-1383(+)